MVCVTAHVSWLGTHIIFFKYPMNFIGMNEIDSPDIHPVVNQEVSCIVL